MGMESYFVNLIPEGVKSSKVDNINEFKGQSKLRLKQVSDLVDSHFKLKKYAKDEHILEDVLFLRISHEKNILKALSIEGSLSWFEEGLRIIFRLYELLRENALNIRISHPSQTEINTRCEKEFISAMRDIYKDKYVHFKENIMHSKACVLPGGHFYYYLLHNKND